MALRCHACGNLIDGTEKPWVVNHASMKCKCGFMMESILGPE